VQADSQYEEALNLDIDLVQKFTMVNVGPPTLPAELDSKIEQL